eukprot:m.54290 g.54290  ORF g.54290 m.54290 type:complete len:388 (-) comp21886_c0_seq1:28-1191(-)
MFSSSKRRRGSFIVTEAEGYKYEEPAASLNSILCRSRDCRFDAIYPRTGPSFQQGEIEIDSLNNIEDTKGNNGQSGCLIVTNLRLLWYCHTNLGINLSVGFSAIKRDGLKIERVTSRLGGDTHAIVAIAENLIRKQVKRDGKWGTEKTTTRFKFIFTNLVQGSPRMFTTIQAVFKAYDSSRLYRECRIRSCISRDFNLDLLPGEEMIEKIDATINIQGDNAQIGSLIWTSVRIVWLNTTNELHNISISFLQVLNIAVTSTKFGNVIAITVRKRGGGHIVGLQPPPQHLPEDIKTRMLQSFQDYADSPDFGVRFAKLSPNKTHELVDEQEDGVDVITDDRRDAFADYFSDGISGRQLERRLPVFNQQLGLAIEELRPSVTLQQLWTVE